MDRTPTAPPSTPRASRSPVDRVLSWVAIALIGAGVFLGVSKHGQPLVPRARELLVPGGAVLIVIAWRSRRRQPLACAWITLVALALIGVGAHEAVSGPWTLLAVPGTLLGCVACLRSAVRGPRDRFFERMRWARGGGMRSKPRSPARTRAWLVFGAVLLGFGVGLAVAAALPPGPTVHVDVVPVASGGDPQLGTEPNLFGLAVKQAHCSGGATTYTLSLGGASFAESCASTSGTRLRPVTLGLSSGHGYTVTIRAVQKRPGRSTRVGTAHKLAVTIPAANSKDWQSTG